LFDHCFRTGIFWGAHATRVLVSATRRNDLRLWLKTQKRISKSARWRVAIARMRVACAPQSRCSTLVRGRVIAKTFAMAEEIVWRGTSSHWKNLGLYVLCGLFCWLIVPIFIALTRYLQTKNKIYELTTERLKITQGVFSKVTDTLELYRVKDIKTHQPFFYRPLHIENIAVNTTDASSPFILIEAVPSAVTFADKMRNQVEAVRMQKGVRELDIE
jgi:membrane protein YdbS with pleckstrin-like domain